MIDELGSLNEQEDVEPMTGFMDESNMRYSDYIGGWTWCENKHNELPDGLPSHPVVDCEIDWRGETWAVFNTSAVAPDVTNKSGRLKDFRFLVSTSDAGLRQSIRPV